MTSGSDEHDSHDDRDDRNSHEETAEEQAKAREIASDFLLSLFGEGLTEEEVQQAVEAINDEIGREIALFDASDDEILETLSDLGLETDRSEFAALVDSCVDEGELLYALCKNTGVWFEEEDGDFNLALTAIGELWSRWRPDEPSFSLVLDAIADGYNCQPQEQVEMLAAWQEAWEGLPRAVHLLGKGILDDPEPVVSGHSIAEWLEDFRTALADAAEQDEDFMADLFLFDADLAELRG